MHLKSLTLKGFKSFPERTRLDFGAGVSVVVGPNGSGKSNVTDAVLWAMGEQSPLAVRGSSMQDVIFGGARGIKARTSAEVEIVLDNGDGTVDIPFSEISIVRRLERSGEGEYRLNGSRCRLGDVIEVLSDTGLGKETHSVISQGRVEAIVASKPRERRLLIEEAAGLGKHRKRRRRAQLKLGHTQENLYRALDIEREARTRLRPLKRQAEAAELHERLERQSLEARLELATDTLAERRLKLAVAEHEAADARAARERIETELEAVVQRRGEAERALAQRAEQREQLARKAYGVRSAGELVAIRLELSRATATTLSQRIAHGERELQNIQSALEQQETQRSHSGVDERIAQLEDELAQLELRREQMLERELEGLLSEHAQADTRVEEAGERLADAQRHLADAERDSEAARERHLAREREAQEARRTAAQVGAQLATVNQFLRGHSHPAAHLGTDGRPPRLLSEALQVKPGYELALTAALGRRLDAALVSDLSQAQALLDRAGPDGATALLAGQAANEETTGPQGQKPPAATQQDAPAPGAIPLTKLLSGSAAALELAQRLLADAWLLERLEDLPDDFAGIAVTRSGRVLFAASGEVRQITEGGAERVLAQRNEREQLIAESERAVSAEHAAQSAAERAMAEHEQAEGARTQAEQLVRQADREHAETKEALRRAQWLIEQRQSMPDQGPDALRRAQIEGELAAERRQSQRIAREAAERAIRLENLGARLEADRVLLPAAQRLITALEGLAQTLAERSRELESTLNADRAAGEEMAGELRACAAQEAEIQARLRGEGERVTAAEVAAQRLRDQSSEALLELEGLAGRLELEVPEPEQLERLSDEQREALSVRVERLARRREQLGPVNPLAQEEYTQALEYVEELEGRRSDLETALRELRTLIRDIDRQIHETFQETFQAAAANFEELVDDVFPGGSGKLTLVRDQQIPRPVLGGEPLPEQPEEQDSGEEDEAEIKDEEELLGVEIEITPAGKSSKRLSLLSGGEKSMTALAFLFAVFLARPCPFYILDEVEAALDDLNLDRFLTLLRRYSDRAQFIVITHQKRTMEAADWLYGVSMGGDGVSKVISRRLPPAQLPAPQERPDLAPAASA